MPTTRNANGATPGRRSTRSGSAVPVDSSFAPRRSARNTTSQGPLDGDVNNPKLPEVQTQQSYAYGSTKTPALPEQLVAREKLTLQQMAETINAGIQDAEQRVNNYAAEAEANFHPRDKWPGPRPTSRGGESEFSITSETRNAERVKQWATSVDQGSPLHGIPEEINDVDMTDVDDGEVTRADTNPSNFPTGFGDQSYNYERGRQPTVIRRAQPMQSNPVKEFLRYCQRAIYNFGDTLYDWIRDWTEVVERLLVAFWHLMATFFVGLGHFVIRVVSSKPTSMFAVAIASLALWTFFIDVIFCQAYRQLFCSPMSTSSIQTMLQTFCGDCDGRTIFTGNLTSVDQAALRPELSSLNQKLGKLSRQIQDVESRADGKFSQLSQSLGNLLQESTVKFVSIDERMTDLSNRVGPSADSIHSPLMQKINYFATGVGAVINPHLTSPTKQKSFPLYQRIFLSVAGIVKYNSNPPVAALEPWEDIGDCWCSAISLPLNPVQLGIRTQQMIYPTEVVIEHYPNAGSPTPDTAPRTFEVWADFNYLSADERDELPTFQNGRLPIYRGWGYMGGDQFDGRLQSESGVSHVQTFKMMYNQHHLLHASNQFVIRINSSWGADYTCLYRVRMHGVPVEELPKVSRSY